MGVPSGHEKERTPDPRLEHNVNCSEFFNSEQYGVFNLLLSNYSWILKYFPEMQSILWKDVKG